MAYDASTFHGLIPLTPDGWPKDEPLLLLKDVEHLVARIEAQRGNAVYFMVDDTLHRGYRDESGRFTLEQCNLSKANQANNLDEIPDMEASEVNREGAELCGHCFPNG